LLHGIFYLLALGFDIEHIVLLKGLVDKVRVV
jgi:hypothetical protein